MAVAPTEIHPHVPMGGITRSADHRYTFDGKTYPGTTNLLKVLGATFQQAAYYGAKQCAGVVADLLDAPGTIEAMYAAQGRPAFVKGMSDTATKHRDEKAALGTEVHDLADQLIRGVLDPAQVPERSRGHVRHYVDWWTAAGWTVRASEAMLVNPEQEYGGTLDLLCYDRDGKTVLADLKTGKGIYKEAILQLTAYGLATYIQVGGIIHLMPRPIDRYVILHVTGEKPVHEIEVNVGLAEQMAWLSTLDVARWAETQKGKRL